VGEKKKRRNSGGLSVPVQKCRRGGKGGKREPREGKGLLGERGERKIGPPFHTCSILPREREGKGRKKDAVPGGGGGKKAKKGCSPYLLWGGKLKELSKGEKKKGGGGKKKTFVQIMKRKEKIGKGQKAYEEQKGMFQGGSEATLSFSLELGRGGGGEKRKREKDLLFFIITEEKKGGGKGVKERGKKEKGRGGKRKFAKHR